METSIDPFWSLPPCSDQDRDIQMEENALFTDTAPGSSDQAFNAAHFIRSDLGPTIIEPPSRQDWYSSSMDMDMSLIPAAKIPQGMPDFFGNYSATDTTYPSDPSSGTLDDLNLDIDFDEELQQLFSGPISTWTGNQPRRREKSKRCGYPCGSCNRIFDRNCDLTKHHKRAHLAESARPLPCLECPKRFCDLKDLNRHVTSLHPDVATRTTFRQVRTDSKRRRLHSPNRDQVPNAPKRKRHQSPAGMLSMPPGHGSKRPCAPGYARHRVRERTPSVIHRPGARYQEPTSFASARDSLCEVEQMALDYRSKASYMHTANAFLPGEMVAFTASVILVTPRELALRFSSLFNERSSFKLRSLRILKQRMKLERDLHDAGREHVWARRKVVFVDCKGEIVVVKDADSHACLSRLFCMLSYSNNAVQGVGLVSSEGFNTAVRVRPFWLRPRGAALRRLREAFVQWLCRQPNIREKLQGYTKGLMGNRPARRNKLQIVQIQPEGNRYGVKHQGKGTVVWGARDPGASLWRRSSQPQPYAKDRRLRYTTTLCCAALLTSDGDVQKNG